MCPVCPVMAEVVYMCFSRILGFMLGDFDLLLIYSIQPIIYSIFIPGLDRNTSFIASYAVVIASSISRVIGSLIFGYLADRVGRKMVLITMAGGMLWRLF